MKRVSKGWTFLFGMAALLLLASSDSFAPVGVAVGSPNMGRIVQTFAVGGVLTEDGTLWQFNMEDGVWLDVDEAFEAQGRQTKVHPLPVRASEIARMESFGFLVTHSGTCWLYDLEKDVWREIGSPPSRR
jgi:hypothetical protein